MISHLSGILEHIDSGHVVIDVSGIGYHVNVPSSSLDKLPRIGSKIKLFIYQVVREDSMALYGFNSKEARNLFSTLISVSGIGPKAGMGFLSSFPLDKLVAAITKGDVSLLTSVPGVGRKTAERLIVELKEKVSKAYGLKAAEGLPKSAIESPLMNDVSSALIALGYSAKEARTALSSSGIDFNEISSVEEGIKKILSRMT